MAPSIYVYESLEDYMLLYPKGTPKEEETPILDILMYRPRGIWVVVELEKRLGPISKGKSLNIILDGMRGLERFRDEGDNLVKVEKCEYFYKENQIVFRVEDQVEKFTIMRYFGQSITKGKFKDWFVPSIPIDSYKFYDASRNRINFILKSPYEQETETASSNLSHASSEEISKMGQIP